MCLLVFTQQAADWVVAQMNSLVALKPLALVIKVYWLIDAYVYTDSKEETRHP